MPDYVLAVSYKLAVNQTRSIFEPDLVVQVLTEQKIL